MSHDQLLSPVKEMSNDFSDRKNTLSLLNIARVLNLVCEEDVPLSGICIDSRKVKPGNLYVVMQGARFDGHQFIADAIEHGAVAVLCQRVIPELSIPQLVVEDTLHALTTLAIEHRQNMDCPVIALTGSNGKTTVKEMIASILPSPSFATPGNLNNHIGVPLSVLQLTSVHRYAVFELGASGLGEIAHTCRIVKPQVALINNIAPAHIEGFGSIDGVARAKGEIYQGVNLDGIAVVNDDDNYAHFWDDILAHKQTYRFSTKKNTDIYSKNIHFNAENCAEFTLVTPKGEALIQLNVPGSHNISNALAAAACAYALNIDLADIAKGLCQFTGVAGRMACISGLHQAQIIDDTYNANLNSVLTALHVLSARSGVRIFVFGDMGELGTWSEEHHRKVGLAARACGIDRLFTFGRHSEETTRAFGPHAQHYHSQDALVQDLLPCLNAQTSILVKGSRSSAMENIVKRLIASPVC